jgi:glycosyltransferase involved in cell wall biosynthesis
VKSDWSALTVRPTLALLIPAYNAAGYLPRLLASARAQSEPFDEIWVYDDASSDDTARVAEELGAQVVRGDLNKGCSIGKNILAVRASSGWLHFHDADDELMPNFVSLARPWMDHAQKDVVLFPFEERDDATGKHIETMRFDPMDVARDARSYVIRRQINPFCGLYRRDAFLAAGGYDEDPDVLFNEDVAMHIQLAFAGLSFAADTEVTIINYWRGNSMSRANQLRCAQAHYAVLRKTAKRPGAEAYGPEIASKLWKVATVLSAYLDWEHADAAAALARRLSPMTIEGSPAFRAAARISPRLALRAREVMVRALQPDLRAGYPARRPLRSA